MDITSRLFALQDTDFATFHARLVPDVPRENILGVRVPLARKLAKEVADTPEAEAFLRQLPHTYYDENLLHALLLSQYRDYERCIEAVEAFLPYVDNWAVCDLLSPKVFQKHKTELMGKIRQWLSSLPVYTRRFGLDMLMTHCLDKDFTPDVLELAVVDAEEYYVAMACAWFFATALVKQWDATLPYLVEHRLSPWVHRKTIQKARESYRLTPEQKAYLLTLKEQ